MRDHRPRQRLGGWRVAGWLLLLALPLASCSDRVSSGSEAATQLAVEIRQHLATPWRVERLAGLASALQRLTPESLDAVRVVYEEMLQGLDGAELQLFFDAWARFDGLAAFEYARHVPFVLQAGIAQEAALYSWAVHDALAAKLAAEQAAADQPRQADVFYRALVRGWALSAQPGLRDYVLSHADVGKLVLFALPQVYQREGVDGLLQWSGDLLQASSSYGARMKTFRLTVRTLGFRTPRQVIPFVLAHYGEDYAKYGPRVLTESWLRHDPEAALEWLRNEAPEQARPEALSLAIGTWLTQDRAAALQWLESRPIEDTYYLPAFDAVAKRVAKRDPRAALEWCRRGPREGLATGCLRQVAIAWYRKDAVAAGLWLEQESGLPVEDRVEIRARASRG